QSPARMRPAIGNGKLRVARAFRAVHRLQEEMRESEMLEALGLGTGLREHELQLIAAFHDERRAGLGADADPVDAVRHRLRAVGFNRDAKPALVQRLEERRIELQERLAAGADDEAVLLDALRPRREDCLGEQGGAREATAPRSEEHTSELQS